MKNVFRVCYLINSTYAGFLVFQLLIVPAFIVVAIPLIILEELYHALISFIEEVCYELSEYKYIRIYLSKKEYEAKKALFKRKLDSYLNR